MRSKLETGAYSDGWQFVSDVQLMCNNAWLYNKKSSKVYKFCTKVDGGEGGLEENVLVGRGVVGGGCLWEGGLWGGGCLWGRGVVGGGVLVGRGVVGGGGGACGEGGLWGGGACGEKGNPLASQTHGSDSPHTNPCQLWEVFEGEINGAMRSLGYCCGQLHTWTPQALCCYGKQLCSIPRDASYYHYDNKWVGWVNWLLWGDWLVWSGAVGLGRDVDCLNKLALGELVLDGWLVWVGEMVGVKVGFIGMGGWCIHSNVWVDGCHPLTHPSAIHHLIHSPTHHSSIHPLIHSSTYSHIHSSTHTPTHPPLTHHTQVLLL